MMWAVSAVLTVGSLFVPQYSLGNDRVTRGNPIELAIPHHHGLPRHCYFFGVKPSTHLTAIPCPLESLAQYHSHIVATVFDRWRAKFIPMMPDGFIFHARASIQDSERLSV